MTQLDKQDFIWAMFFLLGRCEGVLKIWHQMFWVWKLTTKGYVCTEGVNNIVDVLSMYGNGRACQIESGEGASIRGPVTCKSLNWDPNQLNYLQFNNIFSASKFRPGLSMAFYSWWSWFFVRFFQCSNTCFQHLDLGPQNLVWFSASSLPNLVWKR